MNEPYVERPSDAPEQAPASTEKLTVGSVVGCLSVLGAGVMVAGGLAGIGYKAHQRWEGRQEAEQQRQSAFEHKLAANGVTVPSFQLTGGEKVTVKTPGLPLTGEEKQRATQQLADNHQPVLVPIPTRVKVHPGFMYPGDSRYIPPTYKEAPSRVSVVIDNDYSPKKDGTVHLALTDTLDEPIPLTLQLVHKQNQPPKLMATVNRDQLPQRGENSKLLVQMQPSAPKRG